MIYTPLTIKALNFAYNAHKGVLDRSGIPYIFHPYHLAENMPDEISCAIALLHDVVEDTEYSFDDLRAEGFPEEVITGVKILTHSNEMPYMEYIAQIKASGNEKAICVKKADLHHNSDLSRLSKISERDLERLEKYKKALLDLGD